MKKAICISFILSTSIIFNLTAQQIGDLDSTFNLNGKVITDFNGGTDGASGTLIQPDGKILVSGYSSSGTNYTFALSRYNLDGTLDTTFNNTGKVIIDFAPGYDYASSIALQTDGKIVAGGVKFSGSAYDNALIRLHTDGSLDSSFGINGKVETAIGLGDAGISSVAIQTDGKIVAAGMCTTLSTGHDFAITRYNSDGSIDNSFGTNGTTIADFANSSDFLFTMSLQTDGKIIVGGNTGQDPVFDFGMLRLDTLGNIDSSFGTNGLVVTDFGKQDEWANGSIIQSDGKIVLAGVSGSPYKFAISRYNIDGSLDTTFNTTGKVLSAITSHAEGNAVCLETGGNIIVAGVGYNGSNQNFLIARYLTNGTLDNTFGGIGSVITDFGSNADKAKGVAAQADGKIVAVGVNGNDFAVARYIVYLTTGIIDFATMNNQLLIYPNPVEQHATLTYLLQKEEKITISIINTEGKLVHSVLQNQLQTSGEHIQTLSLPENLANGTYFIVISNGTEQMSIKFVK